MSPPSETLSLEQKLLAFADGELDAAQRLEVLDYLAAHPEALNWVRDQQRLSLKARTVLTDSGSSAPGELRAKIMQITASAPLQIPKQNYPTRQWRGTWRMVLAACLFIAIGLIFARVAGPSRSLSTSAGESVIPASIVARATRVHAECSRLAERLHSAAFPQSEGQLAAGVERDLHSDRPYPDLSPIGFRYVGAGPCEGAMQNSVHLLYHSIVPGSISTISLFVQPNRGQFSLVAGEVYDVAGPDSPFPMLCWRTVSVVYFLIADSEQSQQKALSLIRDGVAAPATTPTTPATAPATAPAITH